MNERIRELAEQAGMVAGGYANTPEKIMTWRESFDCPGSLEKFAELIVGECMKLNHEHFNDEDPYSIDSLYRYHFGFKE